MTLLDVSKLDAVGAPLYDMRKIFQIDAPASKISFSLITIHPGARAQLLAFQVPKHLTGKTPLCGCLILRDRING